MEASEYIWSAGGRKGDRLAVAGTVARQKPRGRKVWIASYHTYDIGTESSVGGIAYSLDIRDSGSWKPGRFPDGAKAIKSIAYGNGIWVAATSEGLYWSEQGICGWTKVGSANWGIVKFLNGAFFAMRNYSSNSYIYRSFTGRKWHQLSTPSKKWFDICYGGGLYVAYAHQKQVYSSSDLKSWTQRLNITQGSDISDGVVAFDERSRGFILITDAAKRSTMSSMVSRDGKTWYWQMGEMISGSGWWSPTSVEFMAGKAVTVSNPTAPDSTSTEKGPYFIIDPLTACGAYSCKIQNVFPGYQASDFYTRLCKGDGVIAFGSYYGSYNEQTGGNNRIHWSVDGVRWMNSYSMSEIMGNGFMDCLCFGGEI